MCHCWRGDKRFGICLLPECKDRRDLLCSRCAHLGLSNPRVSGSKLGLVWSVSSMDSGGGGFPCYENPCAQLGPASRISSLWLEYGVGLEYSRGVGAIDLGFLGSLPPADIFGGDSSWFFSSVEAILRLSTDRGDPLGQTTFVDSIIVSSAPRSIDTEGLGPGHSTNPYTRPLGQEGSGSPSSQQSSPRQKKIKCVKNTGEEKPILGVDILEPEVLDMVDKALAGVA